MLAGVPRQSSRATSRQPDTRSSFTGIIQGVNADGSYTVRLNLFNSQLIPAVQSLFFGKLPVGQNVYLSRTNDRKWNLIIIGPTDSVAQERQVALTQVLVIDELGVPLAGVTIEVVNLLTGFVVAQGVTGADGLFAVDAPAGEYSITATLDLLSFTIFQIDLPRDLVTIELLPPEPPRECLCAEIDVCFIQAEAFGSEIISAEEI